MFSHHDATEEDLGDVHAATARRMWFVRKERPTWYAAAKQEHVVRTGRERHERSDVPFIQPNPFAGHHLEIDALITVLGIDKVREPDRVKLLGVQRR